MKNDEKFAKQWHDNQVYNSTLRMTQTLNYQKRQDMTNGLRNRYHQLTEQKRGEVGQVKRLKSEQKQLKAHMDYQRDTEWNMKKDQIRYEREMGLSKMNGFLFMKQEMARLDKLKQLNEEQQQITNYESEAKFLEQMEAELIKKLQETQQIEKKAFNQLESAMIESSLPMKKRVFASQDQSPILQSAISSRSKKQPQ